MDVFFAMTFQKKLTNMGNSAAKNEMEIWIKTLNFAENKDGITAFYAEINLFCGE
jgi:hypothetical protein